MVLQLFVTTFPQFVTTYSSVQFFLHKFVFKEGCIQKKSVDYLLQHFSYIKIGPTTQLNIGTNQIDMKI